MQPASGGPSDPPRVPPYLATKRRRWLSLVVLCAALAVANGPVLCWQTLVPIMVESEGAFRGHDPIAHLDLIFAIGNGLGSITNLPSGMIYDRIGPRRTAVIGALLTSIGLAGLGLCLQYPWANGGMYVFYPAATIFAFLNSWGAFAYLWLLPESPALVNACICAAFSLSDTLGLVAAQLHQKHGLALHDFFYILGAGAVGAAVVSALLLPGRDEFRRLVAHAKQEQDAAAAAAAAAAAGATGPAEQQKRAEVKQQRPALSEAEAAALEQEGRCSKTCLACVPAPERGLLRDTWACMTLLHPRASTVIMAHMLGLYLLPMTLLLKQYGYYLALFGEPTATDLVNLFSLILGFCGAASVICFGVFADRLGLVNSFLLVDVLALLFAATVLVQEVTAQIVGEVLLTFMANAFFVMAPRLAMLYAPSELFGTYSGGIFLFLGISQLVLTPLVDAAASLTLVVLAGLTHPGARYRFGLVLWSCVVVLTAPPLYRHWRDHPPPGSRNGLPPLPTMADVREARAQHAARRTAERRAKPAGERSRLLPGGAPRLGAGSRGGEPRQERTHTGV